MSCVSRSCTSLPTINCSITYGTFSFLNETHKYNVLVFTQKESVDYTSLVGFIFSKLRPTFFLQKMQNQVLITYTNQLLEKEDSGCRALLKDEKVLNPYPFFVSFFL